MSRRYSGRSARAGGGLGVLPLLLLAVIGLLMWSQHGGHIPGLDSVHAAIFG